MAFLTPIYIRDSGVRVVGGATVETEMAPGDGTAATNLTLYVEHIGYHIECMTPDQGVPNRFEGASSGTQTEIFGLTEVDTIGLQVPKIQMRGVIDPTQTTDLQKFAKLVKMSKTKGIKEITGVDSSKCFLNYVNYYDDYYVNISKSTGAVLSKLYTRVVDFDVDADANKKFVRWTMTLVETK